MEITISEGKKVGSLELAIAIRDAEAFRFLVEVICKVSNSMSFSPYKVGVIMAEEFEREHRTLQGVVINMLISFLIRCADFGTDARNETAVRSCQFIKRSVDTDNIRFQQVI